MLKKMKMFSMKEIGEICNAHVNTVAMWREEGLIVGIKTGKNYMFSQDTIIEFQNDYKGMDVSNRVNAAKALKLVCERKAKLQYVY